MSNTSRNERLAMFFARMNKQYIGLTYDDVRLRTTFSDAMPSSVTLDSRFSRRVPLRIPIVGAAMDTVTESAMAIALASAGGIGVIHKNMTPEAQASEVRRVKNALHGMIADPVCVRPDMSIGEVLKLREQEGYSFHSFPVVANGALLGLLTENDITLASNGSADVAATMTGLDKLIFALGVTTVEQAFAQMQEHKKKVIPVVDEKKRLLGLYVLSDVKRVLSANSLHNVDDNGHLRVAAAVGVGESAEIRAKLLAEVGCDAFVIDTAHGDSSNVFNTIKTLSQRYQDIDVVAGNISGSESAGRLAEAGVDGILVGQGGGSICTTRVVAGIGTPQVTAIYDCVSAVLNRGIPVCADGGIRNPGDIAIALALGAESVCLGRALAGTIEAPGEVKTINGTRVKYYRGMASAGALSANAGSRERYREDATTKAPLPEGVESYIPFTGTVAETLSDYIGGVKKSCGYLGAHNLEEFREHAELIRITQAGLTESHPHDVMVVGTP